MAAQLCEGRRVDGIALSPPDLLRGGRRRFDAEGIAAPSFFREVLHHELRHGASADVAVAHEKYSRHIEIPSSDAAKRRVLRSFAGFLLLFQMITSI